MPTAPTDGADTAWPVAERLRHLAAATRHLLADHSCDHQGYELWQAALEVQGPHGMVQRRWQMRPRPMKRVRFGRSGAYTAAESLEAQAQVVLACGGLRGTFPRGTTIAVEVYVYCWRRWWRGDVDNLAKLVLDALRDHRLSKTRSKDELWGAAVYDDDRQIRRLVAEQCACDAEDDEGVVLRMYPYTPRTGSWRD